MIEQGIPTAISYVFDNDFDALMSLDMQEYIKQDNMGRNAIHAACHKGYENMLVYMLTKFGDNAKQIIAICDNRGNTAAHYAAGESWPGIITAEPILLQREIGM